MPRKGSATSGRRSALRSKAQASSPENERREILARASHIVGYSRRLYEGRGHHSFFYKGFNE